MSDITRTVGQRLRRYRIKCGYTQQELGALAGFHHTYIGQLERGEKNATLETLERISGAMKMPLSLLFEKMGDRPADVRDIPLECYEYLSEKSVSEQEQLMNILRAVGSYHQTRSREETPADAV